MAPPLISFRHARLVCITLGIRGPPVSGALGGRTPCPPQGRPCGRSSEKEALIKKLISSGDGHLGVVSVWGMGGMGKSSLVSMVRNDPELLDAYDYGVWVTVPHPLDNTDEFKRQLWKGLGLQEAAPAQDKRYMIVVDDLLTKEEWDQVWSELSKFKKTKGSRIIFTTRRKDVAGHCAGSVREEYRHVDELKPLGDEESMSLLCSKVSGSKIRHLVVSRWKREKKLENIKLSYIRSLTVFGDCPDSLISPKMRLLRVLDLEDTTNLKNEDLRNIGDLPHLSYLSLRGTMISKLPSSLQNLRFLETLDIQDTQVTRLPDGIEKLEKLRYLIAGVKFSRDLLQKVGKLKEVNKDNLLGKMDSFLNYNRNHYHKVSSMDQLSVRAPKGIDKLRNLHLLGSFIVGQGSVARRLEQLTDLQWLGVTINIITEKGNLVLCQSIVKLDRLQKLELRSRSLNFLAKMDGTATKHLASLKLFGNLRLFPTTWITSLNDLIKVKLVGTNLKKIHIDILGGLRSVAFLGLWEESYKGKSLCFNTGKFPKLKFLDIDGLKNIEKVHIKNGAMPELEKLWVNNCKKLCDSGDGLSGVPSLEKLNELLVKNCGKKEKLMEILQLQVNQHRRRPTFRIGKSIVPPSSMPSTSGVAKE